MPLTSPTYPVGPYRFYHREFFIITYRTHIIADPTLELGKVVHEYLA